MEEINQEAVAEVLRSVSSYGGQLAAVFHNYLLITEIIPWGFEGIIHTLDATLATLKQVLTLIEDDLRPSVRIDGRKVFSEEGLNHVRLLALECASSLAKVEPIIEEWCLARKDRNALQKGKNRASSKKSVTVLDTLSLSLDEKEFLEKMEKTRWGWAIWDMENCMERLYELQFHLLLVFQVATVYIISRDVSPRDIDIERLVTYHNRIKRTADLVGLKSPVARSAKVRVRYESRKSSSSLDSFSSDSDIDALFKRRNLPNNRYPPSLPPMCDRSSPSPVTDLTDLHKPNTAKLMELPEHPVVVVQSTNPPSCSESREPKLSSTMLVTVTPVASEAGDQKDEEQKTQEPKVSESATVEARQFNSKSTGLGFKFKKLFRSKKRLAEQMGRTLSDSETQFTAFIIQKHFSRPVPHSVFHSLEATHMKTIHSQLNNNSWYKTFSTLDLFEHITLDRLLHPSFDGKAHERELVVLKVLQQNRVNTWMVLLSQMLHNRPFPQTGPGRVTLAIFREKLENGKPIPFSNPIMGHPPPPPMENIRNIRRPALLHTSGQTTKVSDLKIPPDPSPPQKRRSDQSVFSDRESDSTAGSSNSNFGFVRRRLRKHKAKKSKDDIRVKSLNNSDCNSGDEEWDVIKIDLKLKKGDDVVKKLLDFLTAGSDGKGKGKVV